MLPKSAQQLIDEQSEELLRQAQRAQAARTFILMNSPCGAYYQDRHCGVNDEYCARCSGMLDVLEVLNIQLPMRIPREELH